MLQNLSALMAPALMERLTLVVNHVLAAEPVAMSRLKPHAGRTLRLCLDGWPTLLPPLPVLCCVITPAGLLEWSPQAPDNGLVARLDASNPAALALGAMRGERPDLRITGDAALAAEVDWLLQNLRWDVGADLERVFGPLAGAELYRLGGLLARGLRQAVSGATDRARSMRPGGL
ncbi:MAG: hypothetical protein ACKVQR_00650 [Aquabacterium sp.]